MRPFIVAGLLCLWGALGCERAELPSSALEGTWSLAESSRHFLPSELQGAKSLLVLESDGTFRASAFPGVSFFLRQDTGIQLVNGSGSWRPSVQGGHRGIDLIFDQIEGVGPQDVPYGTWLGLSEAWTPLRLFYFEGDPDSGRRIEFERT